jgi:3',5'-cyclic AMP phosphodiesterase CpdA
MEKKLELLLLVTWCIKNSYIKRTIDALYLFFKALEEIAPLIVIAGNHDLLENNKDRLDSITPVVQFL